MEGWIKLFRKMRDWAWYKDAVTKAVFIELLFRANYHEGNYWGIEVGVGQAVFGRKELAECLGLTEQNIKTALKHLKSTNDVTTKSTNRFTLVTITNWAMYQSDIEEVTNEVTNKVTNNQPTSNQQVTTSKNERKKEGKNIIQREYKEKDFMEINHGLFASIKEAIAQ